MAEVSVTDTGIGLPADELERIFESFYQVRRGGAPKVPGSGLGLALARRIVELHGGAIRAESEGEGKGSRFLFTLPLAAAGMPEITGTTSAKGTPAAKGTQAAS
jgi:signal transduction histidine kinase